MRPIQTALCAAAFFGCCILGVAQDGFRGVQRGFGGQQNAVGAGQDNFRGIQRGFGARQGGSENRQGARQGGPGNFGGQPGGFGGPGNFGGQTGGFGGQPGGFGGPPGAGAAARPETQSNRPFGAEPSQMGYKPNLTDKTLRGPYDTSAFMAGEIYVNVVLFESNGKTDPDTENWSKDEISRVINHIKKACAWWEEMWKNQNYVGSLHFTIDLKNATTPFQTSYEPITHSAFREDQLWIGEFLNAQGYSGGKNQMLYQYTNDTIAEHNADFAFNIFVVKADNDRDHYFSDNYRSYTFGRQTDGVSDTYILTAYSQPYDWYSSQSFAHEMAHIFGAADEYPGQGRYTDRSGYYGIQNTNAPDGNPNRNSIVPSLMNSSISTAFERHITSPQSLEMVGWRDSDGDRIIDVLDAPIGIMDYFSSKLNLSDSLYSFSGKFTVLKVPNYNNTKAITINSVDKLLYRNGESGEWKPVNDKDWGEESRIVSHQFKIPANSVLQWKVVDADGTAESKTYTIGNVRNPKVAIDRETRSVKFSFTPATADTGIVRYKIRVDDQVYDLAEKNTFTLSGLSSGKHEWAIQGVCADSSVTDWLSCGNFNISP